VGDFVIGNNNKIYKGSVNNYYGDVYNLHVEPTVKRHSVNPQPPRPPRGFVGREAELELLKSSIAAEDSIFVYGQEGLGKTSLVKQFAHSNAAPKISDGTVFIESLDESGNALGFEDVVQSLFDTFYHSTPPLKVNFATAKTYLSNTAPLVVLDGFDFPASAYDKFPELFPNGFLVVTSRDLAADDEAYQLLELSPLKREDAIQLLAGKSGIAVDINTQAIMDRICELCGDVPLAISKLGKITQRKNLDLSDVRTGLENVHPPSSEQVKVAIERSFGVIYPLLSSAERTALTMVAAAPGISVDRTWLESVTPDQYAVAELEALELIQANSPRMRMSVGLRQVIYASPVDVQSRRNTLLTYLLNQLRSRSLDFDFIEDELGNILGLLAWAVDEKRWADVVALGRAVDPYLTLRGFWDAWGNVLKWVFLAGKNLGDAAIQAWALHQLGSREIGIGTQKQAIDFMVRALRMRESLGDKVGAAYTRHNLNLILIPPPPPQPPPPPPPPPVPLLGWIIAGLLIVAGIVTGYLYFRATPSNPCAQLNGWQEYIIQDGDTLDSIAQRIVLAEEGSLNEKRLPVAKLAIQSANSNINITGGTPATSTALLTEVEEGQLICVPVVPASFTPEPLQPLATQAPSTSGPPTGTAPVCDAAQFVSHVTVPDGTTFSPGATFRKTWRLKNIGTCTWTTSYALVFDSGEQFGAPDRIGFPTNVAPGQTVDISLDMTAPDWVGNYVGYWKMQNANGEDFGPGTATTKIGLLFVHIYVTEDGNSSVSLTMQVTNPSDVFNTVGQEIHYRYDVANTGASPLSGPVEIFDNKVAAVSCPAVRTVGDQNEALDPDESITCTGTYRLTQADIDSGFVTNLATARVGGEVTYNEVITTVKVNQVLSLEISKAADPVVYTRVGQEITYTYTVLNSSNVTLSPIQMFVSDDHINGGVESFICEPETTELAPGEIVTCTARYTITQADIEAGSVTNRASASIRAYGYNLMENRRAAFGGNQTASATVNYIRPPTLEKTADRETYDALDQVITYTYKVKNINDVPIPGPVTVKDDKVEVTCQELTNDVINPNQVSSPASMETIPSLGTGNLGVRALSQAQASPSLSIVVTYERIDPQTINFSYLVGNISSLAIPGPITVTDDKAQVTCPAVTTVGNLDNNLDPNEAVTCTGTYAITQADLDAGSVTSGATASASGNFSAVITTTVPLQQIRALTLEKSADPLTYNSAGETIIYTYVITNSGDATLGPAQFTVNDNTLGEAINCGAADTTLVPGMTVECSASYLITEADVTAGSVTNNASATDGTTTSNISTTTINRATVPPSDGNLGPNEEITCTGTYTITQPDLDRGSVINQATAQVGGIDSNLATVTIPANQSRKLELTKSAAPNTFDRVGQSITYTYQIKNLGNVTLGPAQFTVLDDRINNRTPFNCGSGMTELAPNESFICTNMYGISSADLEARSVTNTATASVPTNQGPITSSSATNTISCTYPRPGWVVYIVWPGDTLYHISTWYPGTSVEELMQGNCLSSTTIQPGQTLYVPGPPPIGSISGIVSFDVNENNTYDSEDPGAPGIPLVLIDTRTNAIVATVETDRSSNTLGHYVFQNLPPGRYKIYQFSPEIPVPPDQHITNKNFIIRPTY